MSFRDRMTANVGDADPVWRYLLEKVAHTALITLVLFALTPRLSLVTDAAIATAGYLVIGKAYWHWQHEDAWSWRDFAFDALVSSLVMVIADARTDGRAAVLFLVAWVLAFLALDNGRWGSPS